jgi:hypothetical protein
MKEPMKHCPRSYCGGALIIEVNGKWCCNKCGYPCRREYFRMGKADPELEAIKKKCRNCRMPFLDNSIHKNKVFCDRRFCKKERRMIYADKQKRERIEAQP